MNLGNGGTHMECAASPTLSQATPERIWGRYDQKTNKSICGGIMFEIFGWRNIMES